MSNARYWEGLEFECWGAIREDGRSHAWRLLKSGRFARFCDHFHAPVEHWCRPLKTEGKKCRNCVTIAQGVIGAKKRHEDAEPTMLRRLAAIYPRAVKGYARVRPVLRRLEKKGFARKHELGGHRVALWTATAEGRVKAGYPRRCPSLADLS